MSDSEQMAECIEIRCMACGSPMVERENRLNGSRFLGCSDYPRCTHTEKVPAFLEVKRAGGIALPGLEGL